MLVSPNSNSTETLEDEFDSLIRNLYSHEVEEIMTGRYDGRSPVMQKASLVWKQITELKSIKS